MLFKYFTESQTRFSIAVNPQNVKFIRELPEGGCTIAFVDGKEIRVQEAYMESATRLSEK